MNNIYEYSLLAYVCVGGLYLLSSKEDNVRRVWDDGRVAAAVIHETHQQRLRKRNPTHQLVPIDRPGIHGAPGDTMPAVSSHPRRARFLRGRYGVGHGLNHAGNDSYPPQQQQQQQQPDDRRLRRRRRLRGGL